MRSAVDRDVGLGVEAVPDPADPETADALDAVDAGQRRSSPGRPGLGSTASISRATDVAGRLPDTERIEHGDEQADDGSAQCEAERDADGADQDGEGGEAVGAGVEAVGDQGGGADPPADPDPVAGDQLVAGEADERRGGTQPRCDGGGVEQPVGRPRRRPARPTARSWPR